MGLTETRPESGAPPARPSPSEPPAPIVGRGQAASAWTRYAWTIGVVALCTLICVGLHRRLAEANLVLIYLVGVVVVATKFGRGPSTAASLLSVLAFDFFFVPPYLTFAIADTQYVLTFLIMLAVALVVSSLVAAQAAVAEERERLARQAGESRVQMEAEKLRNTLLAAISHDLRTPLAAIKGATSLLLSSPNVDPGVRLDLLTSIHEEVEYISRMVTNLLDLTRLESGAVAIRKELQPLEEIVGTVADLLDKPLGERLRITLPPDLPMIPMDALLVQQVLYNLLDNAVHHTPAGTPIELSAAVDESSVRVEVADRGPGLRPGDERKIFDKFYRATPEGKRSGMGLGLSLCEAIVRLHGGRIWAEGRPDGGARFQFTLPREERT